MFFSAPGHLHPGHTGVNCGGCCGGEEYGLGGVGCLWMEECVWDGWGLEVWSVCRGIGRSWWYRGEGA